MEDLEDQARPYRYKSVCPCPTPLAHRIPRVGHMSIEFPGRPGAHKRASIDQAFPRLNAASARFVM